MRKSFWIVAIAFFGLGSVARRLVPVPGDQRPEDKEAIRAHIDSIFQAYVQGDREMIRATHSDEWRGFLGQSRSIIRGIDQYMEGANATLARPGGMVGYRMDDYDVLFYGDIALVPYIASLDVEFGGKRIDFKPKIRVLDVYAKEDGEWIQIGLEHGPAPRDRSRDPPAASARKSPSAREDLGGARDGMASLVLERPERARPSHPQGDHRGQCRGRSMGGSRDDPCRRSGLRGKRREARQPRFPAYRDPALR